MSAKRVYAICALALLACGCRKGGGKQAAPASALRFGANEAPGRLLEGVYLTNEGKGAWRWTSPKFAVALDPPDRPPRQSFLVFEFAVPEELADRLPVVVEASVNETQLGRRPCLRTGKQTLTWEVPAAALGKAPARVEIQADRAIKENGRWQSLIALSIELQPREANPGYQQKSAQRAREAYWNVLESRKQTLAPARQDELIRLYQELPVWESTWFHGVRIFKNPLDLWVVEQLMHQIRPDFVVETGTYRGASALFYAQALNGLGLTGSRVLSVDVADYHQAAAAQRLWRYVTYYHGSSTDPGIVAEMARLTRGRTTLVALDSDHSMRHVLNELHLYAPLVSPGSYIIVEDTHMDGAGTHNYGKTDAGPLAAVEQFLSEEAGKEFERDLALEQFIMSWNTGGWLRRKPRP
jgi:cephalosporin hydroxylase